MERFWKWLMRTDARSIFVVALLVLLLVTGWRLWVALQPPPPPPPSPPAEPVKLAPFRPLGVIGLVSNQFAAQALVVPVNPFRPTFEMMVRNPESGDLESLVTAAAAIAGAGRPGDVRAGHPPVTDAARQNPRQGGQGRQPAAPAPEAGPPPVPKYAFAGMFQRPDGRVAAYLKSTLGGGRFLVTGDEIAGCQVLEAAADGVMLRLPDGTTRTLIQDDAPVELGGR
jgi:hypothetical protein